MELRRAFLVASARLDSGWSSVHIMAPGETFEQSLQNCDRPGSVRSAQGIAEPQKRMHVHAETTHMRCGTATVRPVLCTATRHRALSRDAPQVTFDVNCRRRG